MFNPGNGLAITCAPQAAGVLRFDFTGRDQVTLQSRHMYAFELTGAIDFDAVVRDPVTLTNLLWTYDPGDHLHLNPTG